MNPKAILTIGAWCMLLAIGLRVYLRLALASRFSRGAAGPRLRQVVATWVRCLDWS